MAELKMVTEGELRSAGYEARTSSNSISDDYCPTVEIFQNGWGKDGYLIEDFTGKENDQLFALNEISEKVKLMFFDESIVFNGGYENDLLTEGYYVSASTSLTAFTIELYYDEYCNNKETNLIWSLTEDNYYNKFILNGVTYRSVLFNGPAPYNNTNNERNLYFKITGEGNGLSETDIFKVRQLDYNDVSPVWDLPYYGIDFQYNEGPGSLGQFNVYDEADKGWILEYPDFMTISPTEGTGDAIITYQPKTTNETTAERQGSLYLKSTDGNEIYEECTVRQSAMPELPTWNLTTASTLALSSIGADVKFTVTDEDEYGYSFSANLTTPFFSIIDEDNTGTTIGYNNVMRGTKNYILRIQSSSVYYNRTGAIYLVYDNLSGTNVVKNEVTVNQLANIYTGETYSIYSNGYHSPTKLRDDLQMADITGNNITVEVQWAPDKNYQTAGELIPIFGWDSTSESRIFAEWISGDLYRIHLKVKELDISGATFNASELSSNNLCTIVHKITNNGKAHTISINNALNATMAGSYLTSSQSFYSIRAGGVQNYSPKSNPYSYFGSVKLTVGSTINKWKTWTDDGTKCGWVDVTDTTVTLKQASNYTPVF